MTEPTSSAELAPRHATEREGERIVHAMILGAVLGVVLLVLGRREGGSARSDRG